MNLYDSTLLAPIKGLRLVRLGRNKDGGYVIPQVCVSESDYLLSAGIYTDWSFEDQFVKLSKCLDYILVDPTTSVKSLFSNTVLMYLHPGYSVRLKFLQLAHLIFNLFRVPAMRRRYGRKFIESFLVASHSLNSSSDPSKTSIPACLDKLGIDITSSHHQARTFLKIDIEGSEYELLDDILSCKQCFSGIALEVHDLDIRYKEFSDLMKSLHDAGFVVAHCHPNNAGGVIEGTNLPRLLEITFVNKSLLSLEDDLPKSLPFLYRPGLDFPCDPSLPELEVSRSSMDLKGS